MADEALRKAQMAERQYRTAAMLGQKQREILEHHVHTHIHQNLSTSPEDLAHIIQLQHAAAANQAETAQRLKDIAEKFDTNHGAVAALARAVEEGRQFSQSQMGLLLEHLRAESAQATRSQQEDRARFLMALHEACSSYQSGQSHRQLNLREQQRTGYEKWRVI
jgi:hypothetical protein